MWLILCPSNDRPAFWAFQGLKARGLEPLEMVTAEALDLGVHWEHRVGTEKVSLVATLTDGRKIIADEVKGVINRLTYVPMDGMMLIHPGDREYVQQELQSFFLGWLATLPGPMLNRPTPWGLSGRWRHISEWISLAGQSGLPVPVYRLSTRDLREATGWTMHLVTNGTPLITLIVVGDTVVGTTVPPEIKAGCLRLAALAETALLGVDFVVAEDASWTFVGATPQPDLRLGGEALLDVLAKSLQNKYGVGR